MGIVDAGSLAKAMDKNMNDFFKLFFSCKRRQMAAISLILTIVFLPVFSADYVFFDEYKEILANPLISAPLDFVSLVDIFSTFEANQYTPLSLMSFWLEYNFAGFNSVLSHSINLLLHIIAAGFLLSMLNLLLGAGKPAFFVTLIWAVHPLQVESTAWVLERRNLFYGCFYFASVFYYLRFSISKEPKNMAFACFFMLLSGFAKTLAFFLPFTWLMIDWLRKRPVAKELIQEKAGAFVISLFLLVLLFSGAGESITGSGTGMLHWKMAAYNICFYIAKTILPVSLSPTLEIHASTQAAFSYGPLYLCIVLLISGFAAYKNRLFAFAVLFYLFHIIPLSGLIRVGYKFYAVLHFMYIPLLGLILALLAIVREFSIKENLRAVKLSVAVLVSLVLAMLSYNNALIWQNSEKLFNYALELDPDNRFARNQLAVFFEQNKRYEEAVKHFQELKNRYPEFFGGYYGIGRIMMKLQQPAAALAMLNKAVELNQKRYDIPFDRGQTLLLLGRFSEAEADLSASLEYKKTIPAFFLRSEARRRQGKYEEALDDLKTVIDNSPYDISVRLANVEILLEKTLIYDALNELIILFQQNKGEENFLLRFFQTLATPDLKTALKRMLPFRSYIRYKLGWYPL